MPDQFTVPQFIDAEDKIIGPVTLRQFAIVLIAFLTDAVLWKLIGSFVVYLLVALPVFAAALILAFAKVNGVPFHFFLLNLVQTMKKPKLRVWNKELTDKEVREHLKSDVHEVAPPAPKKAHIAASRLQELTLIVNTGGAYKSEE